MSNFSVDDDLLPTAIIAVDQNHAIRLCSKGAAKLFGYAAQETIGLPVTLLFSDDRAQAGGEPLCVDAVGQPPVSMRKTLVGLPIPGGALIAIAEHDETASRLEPQTISNLLRYDDLAFG